MMNQKTRFHVTIGGLLAMFTLAGCSSDDTVATPDAAIIATPDATAADSWGSFASEFFLTYCGACHGAGDTLRDYTLLPTVQTEMAKIRCGVSATTLSGCSIPAKQFPIGNGAKPTDLEREQLIQWIDNGTLE